MFALQRIEHNTIAAERAMLVFYLSVFLVLSLRRELDWRVFELSAFSSLRWAHKLSPKLVSVRFDSERSFFFFFGFV